MRRLRWFFTSLGRAFADWRNDNSPLVAGGLSFFALFSMVPLAIITLSLIGLVFSGTPALGILLAEIEVMFSPEAARSAAIMMSRAELTGAGINVASGVILLWAGSRVFSQLQRALSEAWHIPAADLTRAAKLLRFLRNRLRALAATLGLGVATVLFLIADVVIGAFGNFISGLVPEVWIYRIIPWVTFGSSLVLFTLLFAMVYRWLPNAHPGWVAIWAGSAVASLLFAAGRLLLSAYLGAFDVTSFFGAAGSVMVILIWIYASMQILLFGARFAWIIGRKRVEPV